MLESLIYIEQLYKNLKFRSKGCFFKVYLVLHGCKVGKGLKCMALPNLRAVPKKNIFIGDNVTIGRGGTFEIGQEGSLTLGNNVLLADNILLSTISTIKIGDWSAIAENCSLRGSFHEMKKDKPYRLQGNYGEPISLGEDTGIGAGCVILMGATIPKGVFVGSNSTVLRSSEFLAYGIYGGTRLKLIKLRE